MHVKGAAALNLFSGPTLLVPCEPQFGSYTDEMPLDTGSVMSGAVHGTHVRLTLSGTTHNSLDHYAIRFHAN